MAKQITFEQDAREALAEGVAKFARAVKSTLGPRGRYAVVDRGFGSPKVTKDGATVADEMEFSNPIQNVAARLMRQAASRTADKAGDGSTTSTVLAEGVFLGAARCVAAGANPILVQRGLQSALTRAVEHLRQLSMPVTGNAQIQRVAAIASNNSKEVGKIIADAMAKVGNDGVIAIEEGKSVETTVDVVEGMQFDRGYLSQYFVTHEDEAKVVLQDPYILLMEEKISNLGQILPILEKVVATKKPLLIIAEDIEGEALSTLVVNKQRGTLVSAACKAPGYGDRRKAMLLDIAVATGARPILKDLGLEPSSITLKDLGRAKRIELTSDSTTVFRGAGARQDIEERVRQIRREIDEVKSDYDREKLQERLARLVGGIAEIRVGGATETEVKEKKKRFENALAATRAAVQDGILPGGGIAFLRCVAALEDDKIKDQDEKTGVDILRTALEAPFRQLAINAGEEPSRLLRKIYYTEGVNQGFDFEKRRECDMIDAGIIDSFRVTRMALENAVSVASMLFTTDAVITEIPKEKSHDDHEGHHDGDSMDGY
ncbi:MAG: chaperonin GroEL [Planctomycetota bacterium]